ncbi:MAG: competence protein ComEA [Gammaproteobacteria bacterium]|nr:MAG: competence protein ComEA [Gammaproteobacteria bacterium]
MFKSILLKCVLGVYTLLFMSQLFVSYAYAQSSQCFADPNKAYQFLLHQEALQELADSRIPININTASEAELSTLKGISSKKAKAIIAYRQAFGDFTQIDDLAKVHGIGIKTVNKNRRRLKVN